MKKISTYTCNDIDFNIDEDGELCGLFDNQADLREVFVPSKLPVGDGFIPITSIGAGVCRCAFSKVVISDEIKVIKPRAFSHSYVDEVVWPKSCKTIPYMCFASSHVEKVYNIDNVTEVEERAFQQSHIRTLSWPSECKSIPTACFSDSFLTDITNMNWVNSIANFAFCHCHKLIGIDLSNSFLLNVGEYAFTGLEPESINWPYYYSADAFSAAFKLT